MKPSIGRIVHYQPWQHDEGCLRRPFAAIIVEDDAAGSEHVRLTCFPYPARDARPVPGPDELVPHAPNDRPTPGFWNWPPRVD